MFHSYPSKRRPERLAEDGNFLPEDSPRQICSVQIFSVGKSRQGFFRPSNQKASDIWEDIARSEVVRLARFSDLTGDR